MAYRYRKFAIFFCIHDRTIQHTSQKQRKIEVDRPVEIVCSFSPSFSYTFRVFLDVRRRTFWLQCV